MTRTTSEIRQSSGNEKSAAGSSRYFNDPDPFALGDMLVMGKPSAKLIKALAVVARDLHPAIERIPNFTPGISKRSCILCSLVVRDFLQRIGIEAIVAPVVVAIMATAGGKLIHSAGIGVPDTPTRPRNWNGHMVVIAPRENYLIDTTLYQINRPAWEALPGMMATRIIEPRNKRMWGLDAITGVAASGDADYEFSLLWLANPTNRAWRNGPDATRERRRLVVHKLAHTFGSWRDK